MDKIKPTREEILATINKIIEEDYDDTYNPYEPINESNLLTDSEMDSFAYAIFWLSISTKYKIIPDYSNSLEKEKSETLTDYINKINYKTYTVKDLIDRIEQCI